MENEKAKISTDPYKGVRDFYPEEMFIQNFIFDTMRHTVEQFGFVEYGASILEPAELYKKAKSGSEIVNEQTYTFKDRGDRDVTLRPEMTPTVTRMVAARKKELAFPLRWYSIPNLFRYEKPQRGRLREHFQLNVDMFGIDTINADVEIISVAAALMKNFGATPDQYKIKVNSRKILNYLLDEVFALSETDHYSVMKLIDKKDKITQKEFHDGLSEILKDKTDNLIALLNTTTIEEFTKVAAEKTSSEVLGVKETAELLSKLNSLGIKNASFTPTLARGFDYYTGTIFEVFDTSPENPRALFGGGRFDDLLSVFGSEKVPAVGFGMGDVTIKDFLETYNLLPAYKPQTELYICMLSNDVSIFSFELAKNLRAKNHAVMVDITDRKLGDQIKAAHKQHVPFVLVIGENEIALKKFVVKELETGTETTLHSEAEIETFLADHKK